MIFTKPLVERYEAVSISISNISNINALQWLLLSRHCAAIVMASHEMSKGGDWYEDYNGPGEYKPCSKHGKRYITQHGQLVVYCDEHKPELLELTPT